MQGQHCVSSAGEPLDDGFLAEHLLYRWCETNTLLVEMKERRRTKEAPTPTAVPASQSSQQRSETPSLQVRLLRCWEVRCPANCKSQDLSTGFPLSKAGVLSTVSQGINSMSPASEDFRPPEDGLAVGEFRIRPEGA